MSWDFRFKPYVPVATRRAKAQREMAKMANKGKKVSPITIEGRTIARTFWGKAWCDNLESYMDFENRLPRGRTYVRNGSVVHLDIFPGKIEAVVSGSELYRVNIEISPAAKPKWDALCRECSGGIGSLVELLQGRFADNVMNILTRKETGLFPSPKEIKMKCSCPDWATMCKHVAAVLYGVGARLDHSPELLFELRTVRHEDLISQAATTDTLTTKTSAGVPELAESDISAVFGIELDTQSQSQPQASQNTTPVVPPKKSKPPTALAARKAKSPVRGSLSKGGKARKTTSKKSITKLTQKKKKKAPDESSE